MCLFQVFLVGDSYFQLKLYHLLIQIYSQSLEGENYAYSNQKGGRVRYDR